MINSENNGEVDTGKTCVHIAIHNINENNSVIVVTQKRKSLNQSMKSTCLPRQTYILKGGNTFAVMLSATSREAAPEGCGNFQEMQE